MTRLHNNLPVLISVIGPILWLGRLPVMDRRWRLAGLGVFIQKISNISNTTPGISQNHHHHGRALTNCLLARDGSLFLADTSGFSFYIHLQLEFRPSYLTLNSNHQVLLQAHLPYHSSYTLPPLLLYSSTTLLLTLPNSKRRLRHVFLKLTPWYGNFRDAPSERRTTSPQCYPGRL